MIRRRAAELFGKPRLNELVGRHRLALCELHAPFAGQQLVLMSVLGDELEGPSTGIAGRRRAANRFKQLAARARSQKLEQVALVAESLIEGGRGGQGGLGYRA